MRRRISGKRHRLFKTKTWMLLLCLAFIIGIVIGDPDSIDTPSLKKVIPTMKASTTQKTDDKDFDLSLKKDDTGGVKGLNINW